MLCRTGCSTRSSSTICWGVYFAGSYRSLRREATCWRELRFSFLRMLVTWWCTVCSEMKSSLAIWALVSACATRAATSLSRRVRAGGSSADSLLDAGYIGDLGSTSERAYSMAFFERHALPFCPRCFPRGLLQRGARGLKVRLEPCFHFGRMLVCYCSYRFAQPLGRSAEHRCPLGSSFGPGYTRQPLQAVRSDHLVAELFAHYEAFFVVPSGPLVVPL